MNLQENVPVGGKTTMRIGGNARYYAELTSREDVEEAWRTARRLGIPLIVLGGGSNTIFADGTINALIVRIAASNVRIETSAVTVEAGKNLAMLINELAVEDLDLSPLTGIPGTVGGAIFGNAGQGPKGIWIDAFVQSVTVFIDGKWETLPRAECGFTYRESIFKNMKVAPILWQTVLQMPNRAAKEIQADIERLLQQRMETQPHVKTAGSVFKAIGETPAWKLIDAAGLRGKKFGGIEISQKHANFFLNDGGGTFADVHTAIQKVKEVVAEPLAVEMRLYSQTGSIAADAYLA
ncbi:MAG: UDP-N-acetylmuramate dehydrogenase [Candidatus Peribacteraceae bacterium]|nr:UDP-N-acetylmuramate dehydrogenase [Candidatus Peribacteraceae bacterium]